MPEHPSRKERDKPYAILWAQHIFLCLLKPWGCSPAAEQKLFDIKGNMTESHGDQGEKSRAPRPKAEPTPCLCTIRSHKYVKEGASLERSQTWLQLVSGCKGSCWISGSPESPHKSSPPNHQHCHYSRGAIPAVLPGGPTSSIHLQGRAKQAAIPWLHSKLTSASFPIPCQLCSRFKQHYSNKMVFHEPLRGSSPAPSHGPAAGSAVSPCFGPSMPCPEPQRSYPVALCRQKGCLESLAAHSAWKSAIHTLLKGE